MRQSSQTDPAFGQWRLVRRLPDTTAGHGVVARRWIALCDRTHTNAMVYSLPQFGPRPRARRALAALEHLTRLRHPHSIPIHSVSLDPRRGVCFTTPYCGDVRGLNSLHDLLYDKQGILPSSELRRALGQVLGLLTLAHAEGFTDGALTLDRILIDPHGAVKLELFALGALLRDSGPSVTHHAADLAAMGGIVRSLLPAVQTGVGTGPSPFIAWESWIQRCNGSAGFNGEPPFAAVGQALDALPTWVDEQPRQSVLRGLVNRVLSTFAARA
jgi:hypothetical protein